jgi:primosomal replication protein N
MNNRWDNGGMAKRTGKARVTLLVGKSIQVTGSMAREQVKALISGLMVGDTRDNGRITKGTEKARITMPMGTRIQVTGWMTRKQIKARVAKPPDLTRRVLVFKLFS